MNKRKFSFWYSEKAHQRWKKTREMGMLKFILKYGILFFGIPMWLYLSGFEYFTERNRNLSFWNLLKIYSLFIPVGGIIYGFMTWHFSERRFKRHEAINT